MLSTLKRYKSQLHAALIRCFPRTTAYLRDERAALQATAPQPGVAQSKSTANKRQPRKKTAAQIQSNGWYPSARLKISTAQINAMRDRVNQAVNTGLIGAPSDEQWAMILCSAPLTRVFAGAGSGKSSTLVLRAVFMLCHLNVPAQQLTVISFTNASCTELRQRLQALLSFWTYSGDASQCVRTFHSALNALSQQTSHQNWFEQVGARGTEVDNPLTGSVLNAAQRALLEQTYQQAYQSNPSFRASVQRLMNLSEADSQAPSNPYRLAGEFSPRPLFEHLYTQLDFAQSLGLNLANTHSDSLPCAPRERDLIEAIKGFDEQLKDVLKVHNLCTFNQAFTAQTQALEQGQMPAPLALSHLLIDEFQDISGQLINWLSAAQRSIKSAGGAISLMAIGDDWQSIYGWRGSSPELFTRFDQHFPSLRGKSSYMLYLTANYRSIEPIIRDGEKLIAAVHNRQDKTCTATKTTQASDHGVQLHSGFELPRDLDALIACIDRQCSYAATQSNPQACAVMVLGRRNEPLKALRAKLPQKLPVRLMTIHKAKGLQAQVAIILDDCQNPEPHPLRNALYAASEVFTCSYDQAMQDEALRLGYVAITRGVSRVLWYSRSVQGATALL